MAGAVLGEIWNDSLSAKCSHYLPILPFGQLWAPLPHINHAPVTIGASQHAVFVPGGTSLLFSYTFMAKGNDMQWFDWLPLALQASVLLLRPIAFRLQRVHDTIRTEVPVCPTGTVHFALIPAVTPIQFPIVIVVKISFPPLVKLVLSSALTD